MNTCETCEYWGWYALMLSEHGKEFSIGHCAARTIGGLTADDYSCLEHKERTDDLL
jgi:hypothetical protein